jgi:hypothetical protein
MGKLEPRRDHELASPLLLTGWQLIAALSVIAVAGIGALMITGSAAAVAVVVARYCLLSG